MVTRRIKFPVSKTTPKRVMTFSPKVIKPALVTPTSAKGIIRSVQSSQTELANSVPKALGLTALGALGGVAIAKLLKKSTKIGAVVGAGIGAGIGTAFISRKLYLDSLSDDDHGADDMQGDSYGDTRAPVATSAALADAKFNQTSSATYKQSSTLSMGQFGVLKVKIKTPECEIVYDDEHYKGTNLEHYYAVGDLISQTRANQIMEWYAWDGPATKYTTSDGRMLQLVKSTGSFYYKYLGSDAITARRRSLGAHARKLIKAAWVEIKKLPSKWEPDCSIAGCPMVEIPQSKIIFHDAIYAPIPPDQGASSGAANSNADRFLVNSGYTQVNANCGSEVTLKNLVPGWYQIIAKPVWKEQSKNWRFLSGYWKWTKYGPRAKSASTQYNRFVSGDHCTNKLTRFKRIVVSDHWSNLNQLVHIKSNNTASLSFRPVVDLEITNRTTEKNGYSRSYNAICKSYKVSRAVIIRTYGSLGKLIIHVMEKFLGQVVKSQS